MVMISFFLALFCFSENSFSSESSPYCAKNPESVICQSKKAEQKNKALLNSSDLANMYGITSRPVKRENLAKQKTKVRKLANKEPSGWQGMGSEVLAGMTVSAKDGITGPMGPSLWQKVSRRYRKMKVFLKP